MSKNRFRNFPNPEDRCVIEAVPPNAEGGLDWRVFEVPIELTVTRGRSATVAALTLSVAGHEREATGQAKLNEDVDDDRPEIGVLLAVGRAFAVAGEHMLQQADQMISEENAVRTVVQILADGVEGIERILRDAPEVTGGQSPTHDNVEGDREAHIDAVMDALRPLLPVGDGELSEPELRGEAEGVMDVPPAHQPLHHHPCFCIPGKVHDCPTTHGVFEHERPHSDDDPRPQFF